LHPLPLETALSAALETGRAPDQKREKEPRKKLPKLTDAERHKRFVEMARDVEASEDPKDFAGRSTG
jgi:hypothetical protein